MLWAIYQVLFTVGFLLMLPRFLVRMRRRGGYGAHFGERLGRYSPETAAELAAGGRIWVHAVSVGELYVALAVMEELRRRRPAVRFIVSVNTSTARAIAERQVRPPDVLVYFPVDFLPVVRRVLDRLRPRAFIPMEYELWPNLVRESARRGLPVALVNGRVSDAAFRGYRRVRAFTRRLLPEVTLFCMQGETDADRIRELGAPPERVRVTGSVKYGVARRDPEAEARMRAALRAIGWAEGDPLLVGGSTWPGEEEALLDAFRERRVECPALRLLLAPRHAERRDEVSRVIESRGLRLVRRSEQAAGAPAPAGGPPDVLLLDTTGELRHCYAWADVIFIGKSLGDQHGGQNVIEPALCGRAVVCGPNMENFADITAEFLRAGALCQVKDAAGLRRAVRELLSDPVRRAECGRLGEALVKEKAAALGRTAEFVLEAVDGPQLGIDNPLTGH